MNLEPGHYYSLISPPGQFLSFGVNDVENWPTAVPLANNECVVCVGIIHRQGGKGRGRYAKLLHERGGKTVVLYHRVSRLNIGSGTWRELGPLEVLALADDLPTV